MSMIRRAKMQPHVAWIAFMGFSLGLSLGQLRADEVIYAPLRGEDVRSKILIWAAEQPELHPEQQAALQKIWMQHDTELESAALLDQVIASFATCHAGVVNLLQQEQALRTLTVDFVKDAANPFFKSNLALYLGRYYVEHQMYDEALDVLSLADAREVVDPASLFFYRAVSAQAVLEIKPALESLHLLLKQTESVPVRYSSTAVLMQVELQNIEEKSLGETAKLMSDSERRLELGHAGEKVQAVQERIISNLDEMIKKMESQGGGGGGEGQGSSNQGDSPAEDSRVKGSTAPGETDPKQLSKEGHWGDLPDQEQTQAKNLINRNFPSHYRQAIEMYFKKLANRPAPGK